MGKITAGQETKAPRITDTGGDGASTRASVAPPVEEQQRRQQRRRPVPPPAAAAGVAATATTGGSPAEQRCCGEEEEDDEQVERFYTLLANIRALRGLYSAGDGPMGGGTSDGRGRKRAREAVEPWRPAFRMEDFVDEEEVGQVAGGARCGAVTTKQGGAAGDGDGVAKTPAAAMARAAGDAHEGGEVAEARGRKLGRRVAARG